MCACVCVCVCLCLCLCVQMCELMYVCTCAREKLKNGVCVSDNEMTQHLRHSLRPHLHGSLPGDRAH